MTDLARAAELLANARRAVCLTGAGISTESGIPDFRSPGGVWSRHDPRKFDFPRYVSEPEVRRAAWQMRRELYGREYQPNAGHHALATLESTGRLTAVITQNIDGLHQQAGSKHVVEIHGTSRLTGCLSCAARWPTPEIMARVEAGEDDPACVACGGILKPCTISFGQQLDRDVLEEARRLSLSADVFVVVGSSLQVNPAAAMPEWAVRMGAELIIVNREPTPLDDLAEVVVHAEAGPALTELATRVSTFATF